MLLHHAGATFEEKRLSLTDKTEFNQLKENGKLPGGQLPIWTDENGNVMNQTSAILIMLGKQHGYYGKDIWAAYEDDWAIEHFADLWN